MSYSSLLPIQVLSVWNGSCQYVVSVASDLSRSRDGFSVGQFSLGIPGLLDLGLISATNYHSKNFQRPRECWTTISCSNVKPEEKGKCHCIMRLGKLWASMCQSSSAGGGLSVSAPLCTQEARCPSFLLLLWVNAVRESRLGKKWFV